MPEQNNKTTRYIFDDLTLDIQRGELTRQGETITLPKLSYDLLVALAEASPALLSQTELMNKVWPDRVIGDETLKQRVKLLRKSLGDEAAAPRYIEAVRGRGYRLIPNVERECVLKRSPSVMLDLSANDFFPNLLVRQFGRIWQGVSYVGLVLFTVIIGAIIINQQFYQQPIKHEVNSTDVIEQNVGKPAYNLYLKGREYYQRYRKLDNSIAINFYIKAIEQAPNFSQAFAGLSQAYSQQYYQFDGDEQDKQQAIDNAYHAISYDNQSADAYKALGTAYYVSGWLSKSINALLRAAKLAPNDKEVLTNLAFIYSELGNFEQAFIWHKKAITIVPDYALAMMHTGISLQRVKQYQLAEQWYKKALEQKPDYVLTQYHLAQLYMAQGNYQAVNYLLESALKLEPEHPLLLTAMADNYYFQGQLTSALSYYVKVNKKELNQKLSSAQVMTILLAENTKISDIEGLIAQLKIQHQLGNEKAEISLNLAKAYSKLNKPKQAMRYFVQAIEQGLIIDKRVESSPLLSKIRSLPGYQKLYRRQQSTRSKFQKPIAW